MRFEEWFQSKQGQPYISMFMFAKDAWEAATAQEREACAKDNCAAAIRARSDLWDEDRIDVIAQNGNDGIHYDPRD